MPALPLAKTICLGFTIISHSSQVLYHVHQVDFNTKQKCICGSLEPHKLGLSKFVKLKILFLYFI